MNAKEFHEHYGVAVVKKLLEQIDVGRVYWNCVKNGHTTVSVRQALKLAKASSDLVGPDAEAMTVIDLLGLRDEAPRFVGCAHGKEVRKRIRASQQPDPVDASDSVEAGVA